MEITLKFSIEKRLQFFGTNEFRGKKNNCLDNKNDNYYHLITATEREASWIHLHSFCLFYFSDNLKIQSSFKSKSTFSAIIYKFLMDT